VGVWREFVGWLFERVSGLGVEKAFEECMVAFESHRAVE